ncbi:MAG: hypothetical protein RLZZ458_301 [Planctomycetota bacterium]|jgi:ribose-phosphate pyrophosphokinase
MTKPGPAVFALHSSRGFGEAAAAAIGVELLPHEERQFEDGEFKVRPLCSVRNRHVFVIQSLYGESDQTVCDKLCRLLFFTGALRDAGAQRVTLAIPYLCFARKDQRSKPRDPVTTRYVAALMESAGATDVFTMDVHNIAAFQNAFRIPAEHLESRRLLLEPVIEVAREMDLAVVSPDIGGVRRAAAFREALSRRTRQVISSAFVEKHRSAGVVSGDTVIGDVEGRTVVLVDDMISRGTTISRAAQACRNHGALQIWAVAAHGLFAADAETVLESAKLNRLVTTNSIPPFRLSPAFISHSLLVINAAPLFGEAILRMYDGRSLVELCHDEL